MTYTPTGPSDADLAALREYAIQLADGIERALGLWVVRCVENVVTKSGAMVTGTLRRKATEAGEQATAVVMPQVRALLSTDIDDQRIGPLQLVRDAVVWPTGVLREEGIASVHRDAMALSMFPDDIYDLTPTSFAELAPELLETGLTWGAAKAHVHLSRRRADGQR